MKSILLTATAFLAFATPSVADPVSDVETQANLLNASTKVQIASEDVEGATSGTGSNTSQTTSTSSRVVTTTRIQCLSDVTAALCSNPRACLTPPGSVRYDVLQSVGGGPALKVGETCLTGTTTTSADVPPVITPAMVTEEFKRLTWPAATLQVQPPGGRTLVNLATNLYTADTGPQTQTVTLLDQTVDIEATPTTWTWDHGDGTTQTTSDPGRAYPDLDITHTYTSATDQPLALSVDTTYAGRFRVNGGPWATIPATVTVAGAPAQLQVVTARPQLVGAG